MVEQSVAAGQDEGLVSRNQRRKQMEKPMYLDVAQAYTMVLLSGNAAHFSVKTRRELF